MITFSEMTLPEQLLRAVNDLNFVNPTPIQMATIPWLLENKTDLIALSQTGTGKTAAFGLPIIAQTDTNFNSVQTLILCPTRELCQQITKDFENYGKYVKNLKVCAVYGGASIIRQKEKLQRGVHIVVGTPGRVYDMIRQKVLKLENVSRLILDEADEMLNMGFKEELFNIMSFTPKSKQSVLFSATMPREVIGLANEFMNNPHRITSGSESKGAENIQHFYYKVQAKDKYNALKRIADISPNIYGIIFCRTRTETQEIAEKLQHDGYNADALHGDLSQSQREYVMNRFHNRHIQLLVATDVAARGIDVDDLTHIINFHPPLDPDIYIHRSGRTGRAGKSGVSLTIIHSKEMGTLKQIERRLGREITWAHVPTGRDICEKQMLNMIEKVENVEVDDKQIDSFIQAVNEKLSVFSREELIKRFVSVEFNRFLNYYKDIADLDFEVAPRNRRNKKDVAFSLVQLSIGYTDGLNKRELLNMMNRLKVSNSLEIGQIDIYQNSTIVELEAIYEKQLLKILNKRNFNGKK
ncbi:MAG: DEAD/DEAH box helicase, partial [Candidatus Cloacimonetes bacterium]|nr:DEAD/DEAH box helicase [Candidatus Cloacimonadota bacterium]